MVKKIEPLQPASMRQGNAILRRIPPLLKAFSAQLLGWAVTLVLIRLTLVPASIGSALIAQSICAVMLSMILQSAWWWWPIHALFSPLLWLANTFQIAPGWYLFLFILLALVFWRGLLTQVPLYLSNRSVGEALLQLFPSERSVCFVDMGSASGSLLIQLAKARPDCEFIGVELSPLLYAISRGLARGVPNVRFVRNDFFRLPWNEFDMIYTFLSPAVMQRVYQKARTEMASHSILISNSFPLDQGLEVLEVAVRDRKGSRLFVYQSAAMQKGVE